MKWYNEYNRSYIQMSTFHKHIIAMICCCQYSVVVDDRWTLDSGHYKIASSTGCDDGCLWMFFCSLTLRPPPQSTGILVLWKWMFVNVFFCLLTLRPPPRGCWFPPPLWRPPAHTHSGSWSRMLDKGSLCLKRVTLYHTPSFWGYSLSCSCHQILLLKRQSLPASWRRRVVHVLGSPPSRSKSVLRLLWFCLTVLSQNNLSRQLQQLISEDAVSKIVKNVQWLDPNLTPWSQ